jgi:hypothetical protein
VIFGAHIYYQAKNKTVAKKNLYIVQGASDKKKYITADIVLVGDNWLMLQLASEKNPVLGDRLYLVQKNLGRFFLLASFIDFSNCTGFQRNSSNACFLHFFFIKV